MKGFSEIKKASDLFNIKGSFGRFEASVTKDGNVYKAENGVIEATAFFEKDENGVLVRRGIVKNISDSAVTLNTLSNKFMLDGGEYEIYTQYNGWQNESLGAWQELVTGVSARTESVRGASGASPFAVLWSKQSERGTAFHMVSDSLWEMDFSRVYIGGEVSEIKAEMGVFSEGLSLTLAPGEEVNLPEIIFYTVLNKTDLDAWRLHSYLNKKYPKKEMPVIYNTWLYKFDRFNFEDIILQIEKASKLGVEYFVIDAGWFGKGEAWWSARGDWEENPDFGFCGRMKEAADAARRAGLKFGFWIEAECAAEKSDIVKKHPEYFIKGEGSYFLDFSKDDAVTYILNKTSELIDYYGAEFIKFDFNADLKDDKYNSAFMKYFKGQRRYISGLKEKYPSLYIENCASGGMRMNLRDGILYDSFWPTDNQSPYHGLRIFKDTLKRMSPSWIECWISLHQAEKLRLEYGKKEASDKLISTNDGLWDSAIGVDMSYIEGFLSGSPVGLSFDLASLNDENFNKLSDFIKEFKEKRSFYKDAVCHILADTESVLALQFKNSDFSEFEIVTFIKKGTQRNFCIYPVVDENKEYMMPDGRIEKGCDLSENGIDFSVERYLVAKRLFIKEK